MKKWLKKGSAILLASAMVLTLFPGMQQTVHAAPNTAPTSGYWTDVEGLKSFNLSTSTSIGKIKFGLDNGNSRVWAICGTDGTNQSELALLSTSPIATYVIYGVTSEYSKSKFVQNLKSETGGYLSTTYFSAEELGKMQEVTVKTNEPRTDDTTGNQEIEVANKKLYLPNSENQNSYGQTKIYVGSGNNIMIELSKLTSANGFQTGHFWLRSPYGVHVSDALVALSGSSLSHYTVFNTVAKAVPAFNLNLASVLFASAANAASSEGFTPSRSMTENTYTLRYSPAVAGSEQAVISARGDKVTVTNASGKYLMVQNSTGVYAKSISSNDSQTIQAGSVTMNGSTLEDFNNCKVWIESTTDRVTTATMATQSSEIASVEVGITAPVAGTAFDATATCTTTGVATASTVTWTPVATTAGYNTPYTASVTLTPEADYGFASGVTAKVNGIDATSVINADGTVTVTYLFPATAKAKLTGIIAPTGITVANGTAYADMSLPSNVAIETEGDTVTTAAVTWNTTTPASGSYDPNVLTQQTVTLNGTVTCPGNIDQNGVSLNTTITVTISAADIVGAPTFIPVEGTYTDNQSVTLVSSTAGATIHYTTDGTDPTTASTVYNGAIPITGTAGYSVPTMIKAIAVKPGMQNSSVVSATYTIEIPTPIPSTYTVTVNNGTGDGSHSAGATVTIAADAAPSGQVFDKWTVVSGGVALANAASAETTFKMPAEPVEVTATYRNKPSDTAPAYRITDGAKSTWTKDSGASLSLKGTGAFEDYVSVKVDGKVIDKENYTAKAGSTVITLKPSYLNTLTVGVHTLEMVWKDGSASTTFTVKAAASPNTGDMGVMYLWLFLMLVSVGGMAYSRVDRKDN